MTGSHNPPLNLLRLHNSLPFLAIDRLLLLIQSIKSIHPGQKATQQSGQPCAVGVLLQLLSTLKFPEAESIDQGDGVQAEVTSIAELAADGQVLEDRVDRSLIVKCDRRSLDMLHEFTGTEDFAG